MGYPRFLPDYTVGTVTVTNGSRTVTGAGTIWQDGATTEYQIAGGDMLRVGNQRPVIIESVQSATGLTLVEPWPHATAAGTAYRAIRYVPLPSSQVLAAINEVLPLLGNGWVVTAKLADNAVQPGKLSAGAPVWTTAGNVGVGTTSPNYRLTVLGSSTPSVGVVASDASPPRLTLQSNNRTWSTSAYGTANVPNGAYVIADESAGAARLLINTSGNVGIGTPLPGAKLEVNGSIRATGINTRAGVNGGPGGNVFNWEWDAGGSAYLWIDSVKLAAAGINQTGLFGNGSQLTGVSDRRVKSDITPIDHAQAEATVMGLPAVTFTMDGVHRHGFIADEVDDYLPELVSGEANAVDPETGEPVLQGLKLDQTPLIAALWAHVQALTLRVQALEAAT